MKTFKVLVFADQYVDETRLQNGIYTTLLPQLHHEDTTIDLMVKRAKMMVDMTGNTFIDDPYFENLKQCRLEDFTLSKK